LKRLRPLNLYGWSKHAFDLWALREAAAGRAPPFWAGVKFFNVFGPNEYHKGEMMSLVAKNYRPITAGEPIRLFKSHRPDFGDGEMSRRLSRDGIPHADLDSHPGSMAILATLDSIERHRPRVGVVLLEEARLFGGDLHLVADELAPLYRSLDDYRALVTLPASSLTMCERSQAAWLVSHIHLVVMADLVVVGYTTPAVSYTQMTLPSL